MQSRGCHCVMTSSPGGFAYRHLMLVHVTNHVVCVLYLRNLAKRFSGLPVDHFAHASLGMVSGGCLFYEKIAHEGNEHKHDIVRYDYSDYPTIKALCSRKVYKKGVLKIDEDKDMSAENRAVDMLTSFYFMRTLPYENWQPGHIEDIDIGRPSSTCRFVFFIFI